MEKASLPTETSRESIGRRLLALRSARGITAAELCRDLGLKANAYSQYESGERRPNLDDMMRLALAYGVTLDFIYMGRLDGVSHELATKVRPLLADSPNPPISFVKYWNQPQPARGRNRKVHGA